MMKKLNIIDETDTKIIWALDRHYYEIGEIDQISFTRPWTVEHLQAKKRSPDNYCIVALKQDKVVAYLMYDKHSLSLDIIRMAIHPDYQRQTIGIQLLYKAFGQIHKEKHTNISVTIPDDNLAGHLFFQDAGFLVTEIIEDNYLMQYFI